MTRVTVETAPLTSRIDRRQLRDYRRSLPSTVRPRLAGVLTRAVALIAFPLALLVMWLVIIDGSFFDDEDWGLIVILFPLAIPPVIGVVVLVRAIRRRSGVRQYRLNGFAKANGFIYEPYAPAPPLPGMIFTRPGQSSAFVTDIFRRRAGYALEIGNHTCTTGSGRSTATYRWGYAAMRLPVALPHIVLDAHGNNTIGRPRLPIAFANSGRDCFVPVAWSTKTRSHPRARRRSACASDDGSSRETRAYPTTVTVGLQARADREVRPRRRRGLAWMPGGTRQRTAVLNCR